jgi:O-antigen/teichoic acid export membrane protein
MLRGVSSIVAGSVVGQALVMLAYPLLTRLYTPAEFGLLTVFASVVGMVSVVSAGALESAVVIPVQDREAAAVAWAGLASVCLVAALTGIVGTLAATPLSGLLGVPALAGYWWLVSVTVLVMGSYLVLSEWMVRDRSYGALGRRNLFQGIGQVGTQLGLGVAGIRPVGLLLGLGAGRLFALGGLVSQRGLLRQPRPTRAELVAAVRRFRRFPMLAMPSMLVNSAGLEIPLLLVSALYGDARAGLLGLTVRVVVGPLNIVGQAVNQVFTGETGVRVREPDAGLARSVRGAAWRLAATGAVPAIVLIGFGPALFGLVFGGPWTEAGEYARYLAVAYLAQFVVTPISSTLFLLERQGQELGWGVVRLLLTVGGPLVCGLVGAPIQIAIIVLAVGHTLSYAALYALCVRAAGRADRDGRAGESPDAEGSGPHPDRYRPAGTGDDHTGG